MDPETPVRREKVLITGAAGGIGLALTRQLLAGDFHVIASFRQLEPPSALASLAQQSRGQLDLLTMDVTDDTAVEQAGHRLEASLNRLDVLVNNAGIMPPDSQSGLEDLDLRHFAGAFETNVTSVARVSRAFLPLLRRSRRPRILNISSRAASIGEKDNWIYYAYGASKAALNMLTRTMANELRSDNIAVTAVTPGWVRTPMGGPNATLTPEESAASLARLIGRLRMVHSGQFLDRDQDLTVPW